MMDEKNRAKLDKLNNQYVIDIVERYSKLCKPSKITVLTGSEEDKNYIRELVFKNKEEARLSTPGHSVHFDGYYDQGRDKEKTKVLLSGDERLSKSINTGDRDKCLEEIFSLMDGIMKGREMLVMFFCLGPTGSRFAIPALQITDSAYVAHSENIIYRQGYEEFKHMNGSKDFFHFVHASGELENSVSRNHENKRIYIDLKENRVFSVNTQYAGNSVGLKKLAMRLAINKANHSDWLCEHMFLMGVEPEGKKRTTYFCGAFPSACGKTSTAMIPGQKIVGDDILYLRRGADGKMFAVNVEQGIFGIIQDVNPIDDPLIYHTLVTPRELIFSNILVADNNPYWLGMEKTLPEAGINYAGHWKTGNIGPDGNEILPAHKNARYTIKIQELPNADVNLHNPDGVLVSVIIYGGRDPHTSPPVVQSFDWQHGVFIGASLESETTSATIGQAGVRKHDPMAIIDFLVVPLGAYINNHLKFGSATKPPIVFTTNYFLKENDKYLNEKTDKKIWLLWMEGRFHNEYGAIKTPIGFIPKFEDLRGLFKAVFKKEYSREAYERQFSIKITNLLEKLERIETIYKEEHDIPQELFDQIHQQRERLLKAKEKYAKEVVSPFEFSKN
ncbi:MAG: phosphoenolpyruvate carboxykinase (GTP) [Candidatus Aenigmatarchaeota archaeon]